MPVTADDQIKAQMTFTNTIVQMFTGKAHAVYKLPLVPTADALEQDEEDPLIGVGQSFIALTANNTDKLVEMDTNINAKIQVLIDALAKHGVDLGTTLDATNTKLVTGLKTNSDAQIASDVALNAKLTTKMTELNTALVAANKVNNDAHMEQITAVMAKMQANTDEMVARLKTSSADLMLALSGLPEDADYAGILSELDITDKDALDAALHPASFLSVLINSSGDYDDKNDPFFQSSIVKAIQAIGLRFDYMDAKSSVVVKAVTSGNGVPDDLEATLPSALASAINKSRQTAIDSIG